MTEWWPLIAAFWAALLVDCVKLFSPRWRRVFITSALGRAPRPRKKHRAVAHAQYARAVFSPPLPFVWQAYADNLPFAFSPEGICNVTVGSISRVPPDPLVTRSWKWEDIKTVEKKGGRLRLNGRDFCAATPCAGAPELWALAKQCAALATPGERARYLEQTLRRWFRPAHLRRALARATARTMTLAMFATINAIIALAVSVYFLAGVPGMIGDYWAQYAVHRVLPLLGLYAAGVHVMALVSAWMAHRKLAPAQGGQRANILFSATFLPPQVFRLRAQIAAATAPAQHPLAWFAVATNAKTFRERASHMLRDLHWPLAPARNPDPQITARITQWMRERVLAEADRVLAARGIAAAGLLAAPKPDGAASVSYCPRCRDQFTKPAGHCSCGTKLLPLAK